MRPTPVKPGDKRNRLSVIKEMPAVRRNKSRRRLLCECDCGNTHEVYLDNWLRGCVKSCGCYHKEVRSAIRRTHGMSGTPIHKSWSNMHQRCANPKDSAYNHYGARGVSVCDRWESFETFLDDMGPIPKGMKSIERIDNEGDYCPENCRWATPREQCNNRRSNRFLELEGRRLTISQWSDVVGISGATLGARKRYGWSDEKTLTTPLQKQHSHRRKN